MLEAVNLTKTYKNGRSTVTALKDVSVTFEKGRIYGIVGHNGAGKTTLIKLLCGLLFPTGGSVFLNKEPLYPSNFRLLTKIGAILEGSRNIFWNLTPLQNVKYFSWLREIPFSRAFAEAERYFELLDLKDKLNTPVRNLSQGMKQKIAIIISLLHDPEILLLDEPTLGLDPISSSSMQNVIREIAEKRNKLVIITSHQLNIIERLSHMLLFLSEGTIKFFGNIKEFLSQETRQTYLITTGGSLPETDEIFRSLYPSFEKKNDRYLIKVSVTEQELAQLIQLFGSKEIKVLDIEKITPSLEDIFLKGNRRCV